MKLHYNGKSTANGLKIYNRANFDKDVLMFLDKEITITVERKKKKRSLSQNNYYFGVVVPLVRMGLVDIGYRAGLEQAHNYLRDNFAKGELVNENTGEILPIKLSTTEMTTTDFMGYIEQIQQWSAEYLNVQIPDPNEQIKLEL